MASGDPSARAARLQASLALVVGSRSAPRTSNRLVFRLIAIPALAFAGVLIYRGVQERFTLPDMRFVARQTDTGRCPRPA